MQNLFTLMRQCGLFFGKVYQHISKYILLLLSGVLLVLFFVINIPSAQSQISPPAYIDLRYQQQRILISGATSNPSCQYYHPTPSTLVFSFNEPWLDCVARPEIKQVLSYFGANISSSDNEITVRQDEIFKTLTVLIAVTFVCIITFVFWQSLAF
jgi:hypothetical protein